VVQVSLIWLTLAFWDFALLLLLCMAEVAVAVELLFFSVLLKGHTIAIGRLLIEGKPGAFLLLHG